MRWKFVIPALLLFGAIIAFNIIFLDGILKHALISGGQAAFGAKVEVDGFKTKFSDLSVRITGLRVADKNDVWRNLFEAENIRFGVQPLPLLSKKFIIETMTVEGVRWGTQRTTSGALPPRKAAKIAKNNKKEDKDSITGKLLAKIEEKGKAEVSALPAIENIRNAESLFKNVSVENAVKATGLQSIGEMDTARKDLEKKYADYEARLKNLKIDEKANAATAAITEASNIKINGIQDIGPARQKIENLNKARQDMEKTLADVQTLRTQLSADFGDQKVMLDRINELKNKDYQNVASKLQLPSLSLGNVSQYIFGPIWIGRVNTVVYYMHLARKYMPKKEKKEDVVVRKRAKGTDVHFTRENVPPDFLIKQINLSGTTGGPGKEGDPMDFKGVITDITSDPVLLGRPTRAVISGSKEGRNLNIEGIFDHTAPVAVDSLAITFAGLTAQDLKIPQSDYIPSFEKGTGNVSSKFVLKGDVLDAGIGLVLSGLSFNTNREGMNAEVQGVLASLWQGINSIDVNARLAGTPDALQMSVTSNVDKMLADRLQNVYGAKVAELQNRVKAEVDKLTAAKQQELMGEFNMRRDALLKDYTSKEKEVRDRIDGAKAQVTQKENEIRGQADGQRKKAEEELKNKAAEQLKNLFR